MRVLLADDHRMFLEAMKSLLEGRGFTVVGTASDGDEAIRLANTTHPDVAVLDVVMPRVSGLDAARELLSKSPNTRVVLVTGSGDVGFVIEGMALGARGFVVKTAASEELIAAVEAAMRGATYFDHAYDGTVRNALLTTRVASPLTSREREVLRLIANGQTSRRIAGTLGIASKTVETHRARIMKKLDIHDIAGLVRYSIREHIASA